MPNPPEIPDSEPESEPESGSQPLTSRDFRRQQLMDATRQSISQHGISNTTLARVATIAGLSSGIVTFYFTSKQQLLLETLRALSQEYRDAMELAFEFALEFDRSPAKTLSEVIRTHFDRQICTSEKIAVWYAFSGESRARQDYRTICREHDDWFQVSLLEVVTRWQKQVADQRIQPTAVSRGLEGLMDDYWQELLYEPERFDFDTAITTCEAYLDGFFRIVKQAAPPAPPARQAPPQEPPVASAIPAPTFDHDHRTGDLLAPWTYHNEEFLQLEKLHLFEQNWLLACHISDLPEVRDYRTFDALGERALLVRGEDGKVRGFHNVCRHRGAKLVDGAGGRCPRALTCPFHGWTYRLDGNLVGVPAQETFAHLDKSQHGLLPLPVEIWMGFVFVNFAGNLAGNLGVAGQPSSLAQTMKPVEQLLSPYQLPDMKPIADSRFEELRRCNWKVVHDIDNEGYHVAHGHPGLQQLYGKNYRDDWVGDISVTYGPLNEQPGTLWSVRNYQKLLPTFSHLPPPQQRLWLYVGLFPNMVLALYPDSMEFYMTIPVDAGSTRVVGGAYALPDALPDASREVRAAQYLGARINRVANREDDEFVRRLYCGMKSSAFPQPKLSSIEHGVREFHREIQRVLPVARLINQPSPGILAQVNAGMNGRDEG